MQIVQINCPGCGVGLEVKNSTDAAVKDIKCPQCGKAIRIRFRDSKETPNSPETQLGAQLQSANAGPETQLSGLPLPANGGPETQLGGQTDKSQTLIHGGAASAGRLVCHGREYPLQIGENIVGRRSSQRPATIMLDVDDQYMSRQHIAITVTRLPNGSVRATVRNYRNTNDTHVAGLPLNKGEEVVLNNGMTIKMGETEIIYRQ